MIPFRNTSEFSILSLPSHTWNRAFLPHSFPEWGMALAHCAGCFVCAGGGFYHNTTSSVFKFHSCGSFFPLKSMPQPKALFPLVYSGFTLTTIGGYRKSFLQDVTQMDLKRERWNYLPNIDHPQDGVAACLISGTFLYAFGSYPQGNSRSGIQLLNFQKLEQKWGCLFC